MFTYPQPCILKTLSDLHFNTSGTKGIYNKLNKVNTEKDFQRKWHQDIGIILDTNAWQQKFRICFKTIHDPYYKWFQYRILHRILATQKSLYKMQISDSSNCLLCKNNQETIIHLFFQCPKSIHLWNQLENVIQEKASFHIKFNPEDVLLGYSYRNSNSVALNTLIMVTKSYIFSNSRKGLELKMEDLLMLEKRIYSEQKLVANLKMENIRFEKCWYQMQKIFNYDNN